MSGPTFSAVPLARGGEGLFPATIACVHCGQTAPTGERFCCPGCAVAFDTIERLGLGRYYRQRLLDPAVRRAQSSWGFVEAEVEPRFVASLSADLASGVWDSRYGPLRNQPSQDGALRIVVGHPDWPAGPPNSPWQEGWQG